MEVVITSFTYVKILLFKLILDDKKNGSSEITIILKFNVRNINYAHKTTL